MEERLKLKKYKAMYRFIDGYGKMAVNRTIVYAPDIEAARIKLLSTYTFNIDILGIVEVRKVNNGLVTRVIAC